MLLERGSRSFLLLAPELCGHDAISGDVVDHQRMLPLRMAVSVVRLTLLLLFPRTPGF